ncbi:MAG: peptidoglycan-N-acetylmuramate O-acetyltransferase [Frankiales bacterium]|nr:peptidoglycan-N-acetylmuramate O-acetyltransferase [Frankiales bacterium]
MLRQARTAAAAVVGRRRLPGLDGLRALAVLAVVVFHADSQLLPGGFLGVDLFFVISGYLITRLLLGELARDGRIDLARFYVRRLVRLFPALLLLLAVVTAASTLVWRDELPTLRMSVASSLGYVTNWWLISDHQSYFVASGRPPMLQHLWSLAIEEQFYLIWPALVLLVVRLTGRRRHRFSMVALLAFGLAAASSTAMIVEAVRTGVPYLADSSRVYFGSDTHAMGLLAGAGMAALAERLELQQRRTWRFRALPTDVLGLAALIGLGWLAYHLNEFDPSLYRGGFVVASVLAAVAVSTVARRRSVLGRCLDIRPLRWLGDRSYAIYLWHWPVSVVTRPGVDLPANRWLVDPVRLLLPVVLAGLSYRFVERPLRAAGHSWWDAHRDVASVRRRSPARIVAPRLLGVTALATIILASLLLPGSPGSAAGSAAVAAVESPAPPAVSPPIASQPIAAQPIASQPIASQPIAAQSAPAPLAVSQPAVSQSAVSQSAVSQSAGSQSAGSPLAVSQPAVSQSAGSPPIASQTRPGPSVSPTHQVPRSQAVSAFGDSVMLGAQPELLQTLGRDGSGCRVSAVEGRQPYVTLDQVRALHSAGGLSPIVAIHTGNNGIISPADLASTLSQLKDRARVVLLTDRVPRDWQAPNNATIRQVARRFQNTVVLDWYAQSNGHRTWFYDDGLHLRPAGADQYAKLVKAAVA